MEGPGCIYVELGCPTIAIHQCQHRGVASLPVLTDCFPHALYSHQHPDEQSRRREGPSPRRGHSRPHLRGPEGPCCYPFHTQPAAVRHAARPALRRPASQRDPRGAQREANGVSHQARAQAPRPRSAQRARAAPRECVRELGAEGRPRAHAAHEPEGSARGADDRVRGDLRRALGARLRGGHAAAALRVLDDRGQHPPADRDHDRREAAEDVDVDEQPALLCGPGSHDGDDTRHTGRAAIYR